MSLTFVFTHIFTERLNKKNATKNMSKFSFELEKLAQGHKHLHTSLTFTGLTTLTY